MSKLRAVSRDRTHMPLNEAVALLLKEQAMSQRQLAHELQVSQGWLSPALSGKRPAATSLIKQSPYRLGVKPEYFVEYRRAILCQALRDNPELVGRFYDQLRTSKTAPRRS